MSFPYRQDYGSRDKPLRKWDQIGELLRRATQAHYPSERAALTIQIVSLLSSEERKMIGIQDEDIEEWGSDIARRYAVLRHNEEESRRTARDMQAGHPAYFVDKEGKDSTYFNYIEAISNTRFCIDWNICRILRQVYELCESKGVRISHGVEAEGPRGHVIGVSRIVGERVEVESRKEVDEPAEESSESETAESKTGEQS